MAWRLFVNTVLLVGYLLLLILPLEQGILPSNLQQTCQRPRLALHTNRLCEMASKTLKQSSQAGIEKIVFGFYLGIAKPTLASCNPNLPKSLCTWISSTNSCKQAILANKRATSIKEEQGLSGTPPFVSSLIC